MQVLMFCTEFVCIARFPVQQYAGFLVEVISFLFLEKDIEIPGHSIIIKKVNLKM